MRARLEPDAKARLRVLMVSIDPERDTPAVLGELPERHRVDQRWTFAQAPAQDVRELAAVLGVQYRRLPDGEFSHSTVIALLDPSGRIVYYLSPYLYPAADLDFLMIFALGELVWMLWLLIGGRRLEEPVHPRRSGAIRNPPL